jgi:hypothetical protein
MNITEKDRIRRGDTLKEYNKKRRGKSYEQMLGEEKAKQWKDNLSKVRKGIKKSKETREKMSKTRMGRVSRPKGYKHSEETKLKMSIAQKSVKNRPTGINHWHYVHLDKDILNDLYWNKNFSMFMIAKELDINIGIVNSRMNEYNIPRRSHSDKTRLAYLEGRLKILSWPNNIKAKKYKNYVLKSSWELKVALFLDAHNIKWEYEPISIKYKSVDGKFHSYFPDFYLNESDTFLEVKGRYVENDVLKFNELRKKAKLIIIDKDNLNNLEETILK